MGNKRRNCLRTAGMPEDKRVWLKPGDRIRCGIEKLGELKLTFA